MQELRCPIVCTADALAPPSSTLSSIMKGESSMSVIHTRIEGGAKAVLTNENLTLQQVTVMLSANVVRFRFGLDIHGLYRGISPQITESEIPLRSSVTS